MLYCVVPPDASPKVRRLVERALRDDPTATVIDERRAGKRRRAGERRLRVEEGAHGSDRRRVRYLDGRRVGERRAVLVPVAPPALPRRVEAHVATLSFVEPIEVPPEFEEDIEAVRAIVRFQLGDRDALAELYEAWFPRVYTYVQVTLGDSAEVESRVCAAFSEAVRELADVAPGSAEVRPWLFGVAYRVVRAGSRELIRSPRHHVAGADRSGEEALAEPERLEWLTDDELLMLIGRRPAAERHVLVLRYLAGLSFAEIGRIMGLGSRQAVELHRAGIRSVDAMLAAVTRSPRVGGRHPMSRIGAQTPVLHRRRRALLAA